MGLELVALYKTLDDAERAEDKAYEASQESIKSQRTANAQNAAAAAQERRKQLREERINRARIVSSTTASGTSGSSGEVGALGGLDTNLTTNLAYNASAISAANEMSIFNTNAARLTSESNKLKASSAMWGQVFDVSMQVGRAVVGGL